MQYIIQEKYQAGKHKFTAGTKARDDLDKILLNSGLQPIVVEMQYEKRDNANFFKKLIMHNEIANYWGKALSSIGMGDTVILQFPFIHHSLFLASVIKKAKMRGVKIVAFIHDLDYLRLARINDFTFMHKWRIKNEELKVLTLFDKIIVHNSRMKQFIIEKLNIPENNLVDLEIFDYLIPHKDMKILKDTSGEANEYSCIIAGNLDRGKAGYAYNLPIEPIFHLYGINFEDVQKENIKYFGAFPPDDLPLVMDGSFGLVWDGDRTDTCSGVWGEYLKYNNPHKTSLYLACGIPVIIWDKAALADFVTKNKVGITVDSLENLKNELKNLNKVDYIDFQKNASVVAEKMHRGYYARRALEKALL